MFKKLLLGLATTAFVFKEKDKQCCGIVGTVSSNLYSQQDIQQSRKNKRPKITVQQFLCDGIQLLKNRGYDSAGVYCISDKSQRLIKYADQAGSNGKCIQKVVNQTLKKIGQAYGGLAHTRWATCGAKTKRNAHPHTDTSGRINLVHNGILSNHSQLRKKYLQKIQMNSQTDTQVIAQLVGIAANNGKTILDALNWFGQIAAKQNSQWGLVVMDKTKPKTLYTYTHGSPLLIGFSKQQDQIFVVSQKLAFQDYVQCYVPTQNGEIFQLDVQQIKQIKQKFKNRLLVLKSQQTLKKPPPPHRYFYNYQIRQQGTIPFNPNFARIKNLQFGKYLTVLACGSSKYAAHSSEHLFRTLKTFRKIAIVDPVELYQDEIGEDETAIVVSQSGQTRDLIKTIQQCQKRGTATVGIINVQGSTLARKVDYPIYINVGRQTCVAATKSFFHQTLNLMYLATEIAENKNSANIKVLTQIRQNLKKAPSAVNVCIDQNQKLCIQLAERLRDKKSIYLLGLQQCMGISQQAALKIKQLTYIHAEALGACEMKHGPIALIQSHKTKQTPVFLFILDNNTLPLMLNALDQMKSRKADTIVITDCPDKIEAHYQSSLGKYRLRRDGLFHKFQQDKVKYSGDAQKLEELNQQLQRQLILLELPQRDFVLTVPCLPYVTHLLSIIPIQLFVQKMSQIKKIDPDHPRNLAKSVTV